MTFSTNLRCGACLAKLKPILDSEPGLVWSVDLASPTKTLTATGASAERVKELVNEAGYLATENTPPPVESGSLFPLLLIVGYLLLVTICVEISSGSFLWHRAMNHFMAGFFLAFSFFKLLNLAAFADSFAMYDLLAMRSRVYALTYPFIELILGVLYLLHAVPLATNVATLVLMLIGAAGVLRALMQKRRIRCACLGAVLNLPMTTVTLVEDLTMAAMAAVMLAY